MNSCKFQKSTKIYQFYSIDYILHSEVYMVTVHIFEYFIVGILYNIACVVSYMSMYENIN